MASNGTANGAGIPRPPPGPPQPFMLHVRFPMGVRFCPSDEELMYYLAWRHLGVPLPTNFILEEDLYHLDPWELPDLDPMVYKEDEWYFFATTTRLPNECLTTTGHWRDISQAKEIFDRRDRYLGSRFTLTLILDNPRQDTEWYIDEFHLSSEIPQRNGTFIHSNQDTTQSLPSSPLLVLCKIYKEEDYCDSQSGTPLETENLGSVFDA